LATPLAFNPPDGGVPYIISSQVIYRYKLEALDYISVAESLRTSSTTFTQCAPNVIDFAEITKTTATTPFKAIQGHRFWYQSKANRDIAFDSSKIAIFCYPSCVYLPRRRGSLGQSPYNFPWMSMDGQGTKCRRNIAEKLNRLSRAYERYRRPTTDERQTTDRRTGDSI